jgi:hypothetical protein
MKGNPFICLTTCNTQLPCHMQWIHPDLLPATCDMQCIQTQYPLPATCNAPRPFSCHMDTPRPFTCHMHIHPDPLPATCTCNGYTQTLYLPHAHACNGYTQTLYLPHAMDTPRPFTCHMHMQWIHSDPLPATCTCNGYTQTLYLPHM